MVSMVNWFMVCWFAGWFAVQFDGFKLLRGLGMSLLDNIKPIKKLMIEQALGLKSDLPSLAKKLDS